jgi:hypothetical protein
VEASGRSSSGSESDGPHGDRDVVIGQWPDGTAITEAEGRAPADARELRHDLRRYARETRWIRRRSTLAGTARLFGSPRSAIAVVVVAALIASALAFLLPIAR